jgi:2-polyprenyl-3-methyl-5-hydroxy-6-metoxy-1,4-benzoquinol methylase
MGTIAARFFAHVQSAGFYDTLLKDALALLPEGDGRTLLDIGCGPGALTRLAAAHGYHATGIDKDPAMIAHARRIARRQQSPAKFALADLREAKHTSAPADAVVAASLLAVVPNPAAALTHIWECVAPGGLLLILEPSERMTPANARRLLAHGVGGPRRRLLTLWAYARRGRAINHTLLDNLPAVAQRHDAPLLDDLVLATLLEKSRNP